MTTDDSAQSAIAAASFRYNDLSLIQPARRSVRTAANPGEDHALLS